MGWIALAALPKDVEVGGALGLPMVGPGRLLLLGRGRSGSEEDEEEEDELEDDDEEEEEDDKCLANFDFLARALLLSL